MKRLVTISLAAGGLLLSACSSNPCVKLAKAVCEKTKNAAVCEKAKKDAKATDKAKHATCEKELAQVDEVVKFLNAAEEAKKQAEKPAEPPAPPRAPPPLSDPAPAPSK